MPYSSMNSQELSSLLGMDMRQVEKLAQRGDIPCQKVGGELRFNRAKITEWLQQRMGTLEKNNLKSMDAGITAHRQALPDEAIITPLMRPEAICPRLAARTKNSVLKELVALAQETGDLYDGEALLEALLQREELCSTGMEAGIAIPHPRRPLPYAIAQPILVIANTPQGIGFGAPDGKLSDLFFMTCSMDDRHHLHVLARLCRMLHDGKLAPALRQAETVEEYIELIQQAELKIIEESL
ncbi:MAG: PTS system fructose-specific EIIABC component [Planctomycetes bacterium ADurb.Bin412]|nr:MAG: PTS system fructose-specific EIIABC component [Planctomycetes bacterium ADurb.Bin412]